MGRADPTLSTRARPGYVDVWSTESDHTCAGTWGEDGCTRAPNHSGPHIEGDGRLVLAVWTSEQEATP